MEVNFVNILKLLTSKYVYYKEDPRKANRDICPLYIGVLRKVILTKTLVD